MDPEMAHHVGLVTELREAMMEMHLAAIKFEHCLFALRRALPATMLQHLTVAERLFLSVRLADDMLPEDLTP